MKNSLKVDAMNNPIQLGNSIETSTITLVSTDFLTINRPQNAIAVRIKSNADFELKNGSSGFVCDDDEFGVLNLEQFQVKGIASQLIYLRWILL